MANNVNDKGDVMSQLLRILNIPICVSSLRAGELVTSSSLVHRRLSTLLNTRICTNNALGGPLLTSCLFNDPRRTGRVGYVIRPHMGRSFEQ